MQVFPFDYRTGEWGGWKSYKSNVTTAVLDWLSYIGWAYDKKFATTQMISRKIIKSGDGSHEFAQQNPLWGFGDNDMKLSDLNELQSINN